LSIPARIKTVDNLINLIELSNTINDEIQKPLKEDLNSRLNDAGSVYQSSKFEDHENSKSEDHKKIKDLVLILGVDFNKL
jgi:hypothetical protein